MSLKNDGYSVNSGNFPNPQDIVPISSDCLIDYLCIYAYFKNAIIGVLTN